MTEDGHRYPSGPAVLGTKTPLEETEPESDARGSSLTPYERETSITFSDGDPLVRIWTAQRTVITALRKKPQAVEVECGHEGTTEWAAFEIPADQWSVTGFTRKLEISDERRAQLAAAARERFGHKAAS